MKYHHLTPEQRYTIDVLLRKGMSRKEIALTIGVSESTLSRELKLTVVNAATIIVKRKQKPMIASGGFRITGI